MVLTVEINIEEMGYEIFLMTKKSQQDQASVSDVPEWRPLCETVRFKPDLSGDHRYWRFQSCGIYAKESR